MSNRLKVCRRCMERLSVSEEASQDLGSYLLASGSGGVEVVNEETCQYKLACGDKSKPALPARSLADVGEVEIDSAIADLLKGLNLNSYSQVGARELSTAIKNEWLKAREARKSEGQGMTA
jgi:hypothetical protein